MLNIKNFILNPIFTNENHDYIINSCPYKNGDIILVNDIYYKIIISGKKLNISTKTHNKLKIFVPKEWHSYIDFIVNK